MSGTHRDDSGAANENAWIHGIRRSLAVGALGLLLVGAGFATVWWNESQVVARHGPLALIEERLAAALDVGRPALRHRERHERRQADRHQHQRPHQHRHDQHRLLSPRPDEREDGRGQVGARPDREHGPEQARQHREVAGEVDAEVVTEVSTVPKDCPGVLLVVF